MPHPTAPLNIPQAKHDALIAAADVFEASDPAAYTGADVGAVLRAAAADFIESAQPANEAQL